MLKQIDLLLSSLGNATVFTLLVCAWKRATSCSWPDSCTSQRTAVWSPDALTKRISLGAHATSNIALWCAWWPKNDNGYRKN